MRLIIESVPTSPDASPALPSQMGKVFLSERECDKERKPASVRPPSFRALLGATGNSITSHCDKVASVHFPKWNVKLFALFHPDKFRNPKSTVCCLPQLTLDTRGCHWTHLLQSCSGLRGDWIPIRRCLFIWGGPQSQGNLQAGG